MGTIGPTWLVEFRKPCISKLTSSTWNWMWHFRITTLTVSLNSFKLQVHMITCPIYHHNSILSIQYQHPLGTQSLVISHYISIPWLWGNLDCSIHWCSTVSHSLPVCYISYLFSHLSFSSLISHLSSLSSYLSSFISQVVSDATGCCTCISTFPQLWII